MTSWQPTYDPEIDCKELNLVLSPGRMATTTLYRWLNANGVRAFKTHQLDKDVARKRVRQRQQNRQKVPMFQQQAAKVLDRPLREANPVRVIIPLREPLERNLSAFRRFVSSGRVELSPDMSEAEVRAIFEQSVPVERLDNWLESNLFPLVSRVEIQGLMNHTRPVVRLNRGRYQLLFMRCETSDALKAQALSDLVGHPVEPRRWTETANWHNKKIPNEIQRLVDHLADNVGEDYRQQLYDTTYARTFYPEVAEPRFAGA